MSTDSASLNSKYAWRDIARRDLPKRSTAQRLSDFLEVYGLFDEATAREQANRCLQCPNPSCVSGCPLCNPIPQWILLTAEGRFQEAAELLASVTNLAELCVRLCPGERLCENTCLLNGRSEPMAIQALEHFLSEYALLHGLVDTSTAPPNGWRVAVVGSGPGGLACADDLAKRGYSVTVFGSSPLPGGALINSMPSFRMERSVVERRIDLLKKRGVTFRLGRTLGVDIALSDLRSDFGAVYLGFDARQPRPLEVPGAESKGVIQGLLFLLQKNTPLLLELPPLELTGRQIVVLGGGDTALDCARTAIRGGAREVLCVYRREEADMPCTRREYESALEEGVRFVFNAAPGAVLATVEGRITGVRLVRTEMSPGTANGRRPFITVPGSDFELKADLVIAAIGYVPLPLPRTGDFNDLEVNTSGGLVVNENQMTSLPGVFAGGDLVRGPTMPLLAVRDARHAAARIHAFLSARPKPATPSASDIVAKSQGVPPRPPR